MDMLMQLAKAVASAAAALVLKAKNVAQKTEDSAQQNRVIAAATQCALSTSQLVACTRVVAPTISSPVCQEQLIEAGKLVAKSVEGCVEASQGATQDEGLLKQVGFAATGVNQALNELLQHIKQYASGGHPIGRHGEATDRILDVTENIFGSMGDAGEMVRQARILAQATSDLVNAIKMDAEGETDLENSRKLLSAAKLLADATAKMVEAAKGAAANPDSEEQQQKLREAAEGLRMATNAAAQNAIKKRLVNKLEHAAKQAAAAATQTIAAAQHAASSSKNHAAQQQLVQACKMVAEQIPQLVQGVRGSQSQPDSPSAQLALISASQNFLQPGARMVTASKATVPTIGDQASAMQLSQCAKNLASALAELRTTSQKAQEACGPLEIENALSTVRGLEKEIQEAKASAKAGILKPLPGETLEKSSQDLGSSTKAVSNDYGLFLSDEDPKKGIWLEAGKALDYYMLRNGDTLEYKKKQRPLKIRMLDGTVKTVMVDDSKIVSDMLMTICARIGITNYDEYSLVRDIMEEKKEETTGTLKRDKTLLRDERKMEKLKQKLHTDDELNWLDHGRTLREQGVEETEMLLLRRKFFYSDQNVDSRDPVQLNLLYVQARDDILNGSHPVSFDKACDFCGYQCQIQFGDHKEDKHKPGFLDLKEFIPKEYIKNKGEKKIFQAHKNSQKLSLATLSKVRTETLTLLMRRC
ncbi:talin-1-like [Notothenia coriiceps]|uniref:Talin-1-like n=1 Tax=Notothenia coriiceps TaxID=8208 RepID=A0A6I9NN47_9TELE|nr:PREDICTED: talin-1-like [Notothenia coriiceps]